jgi:hypothetical protein
MLFQLKLESSQKKFKRLKQTFEKAAYEMSTYYMFLNIQKKPKNENAAFATPT